MTVSSVLLANAVPCRMPGYRGSSALPFPQQVTGRVVACWRQQTMQAVRRSRLSRTERALQAKQRQMAKLPLASRDRSALRFEVLSLQCQLQALAASAAGQAETARRHDAEATWFAAEARRLGRWGSAA
jgi:hypothetical protein